MLPWRGDFPLPRELGDCHDCGFHPPHLLYRRVGLGARKAHTVQMGMPGGRIILQETDGRRPLTRPLVSRRYGLIGKPDYLVQTANDLIPVEIKSQPRPTTGPRVADVMQLRAYCVLVK